MKPGAVGTRPKTSRAAVPSKLGGVAPMRGAKPPSNAEIKSKVKPVPVEKSREMLKVYD